MDEDESEPLFAIVYSLEEDYSLSWCETHQTFHQEWYGVMKGKLMRIDLDE